jgi:hypothetical protein
MTPRERAAQDQTNKAIADAAQRLKDKVSEFARPEGMSDADWAEARANAAPAVIAIDMMQPGSSSTKVRGAKKLIEAAAKKADDVVEAGAKAARGADPVKRRVTLRKGTRQQIEASQPRNAAGEMIDPNTQQPLKPGEIDVGHKPGQEWRKRQQMHRERGSSRTEVRGTIVGQGH